MFKRIIASFAIVCLGGCMHLKGVVVDEATGRPLRTAVFSVGRPNGVAVYATHNVDQNGAFDFQISTIDENNLYIYDSAGDAQLTEEHLDGSQLSDKMRIKMHPAPRQKPESLLTVPQM